MGNKVFEFVGKVTDRLFVVVGALLGSQLPAFFSQYTQQMSGRVAELGRLAAKLNEIAAASQKSIQQYTQKLLSSQDPDIHSQGEFIDLLVSRFDRLTEVLKSLSEASIWSKPYYFFSRLDSDIFHSVWKNFQPGLDFSLEGLIYAALGGVLGYAICHSLFSLIGKLFKSKQTPEGK